MAKGKIEEKPDTMLPDDEAAPLVSAVYSAADAVRDAESAGGKTHAALVQAVADALGSKVKVRREWIDAAVWRAVNGLPADAPIPLGTVKHGKQYRPVSHGAASRYIRLAKIEAGDVKYERGAVSPADSPVAVGDVGYTSPLEALEAGESLTATFTAFDNRVRDKRTKPPEGMSLADACAAMLARKVYVKVEGKRQPEVLNPIEHGAHALALITAILGSPSCKMVTATARQNILDTLAGIVTAPAKVADAA